MVFVASADEQHGYNTVVSHVPPGTNTKNKGLFLYYFLSSDLRIVFLLNMQISLHSIDMLNVSKPNLYKVEFK